MKTFFAILFSIITISSFASTANTMNTPNDNIDFTFQISKLAAGTLVTFESTESLVSSELTVGQIVQFKVRTSVYANGRLVIRTGASAIGRVKEIKKATYNHPAKVTMEMTSVQSVDGQSIALDGTEQTYKGVYKGQGFMITSGKRISANVMNDYFIKN